MVTIDFAFDEAISKEFSEYLTSKGIDSQIKKSQVKVNMTDFDEKIIGMFLEKTKRDQHVIQKVDSNSYLVSKQADVEDLGLGTCEICGLVATEDKLYSHRWTHGA